ncbi:MAG: pyrroline-5-carboxylate reductase [bacterium]|nr:pyrroline-5-carboxylate reductase [Gammaproteobacteria bacterium]HIL99054.1 pyrroline-5-carboxylate reductase [Pseudomonadales bacterium]
MITTTFIGAGNIAQALMGGYLQTKPGRIIASDPVLVQLQKLPASIERSQDNQSAIQHADVVVLCVKPNMMADICRNLADHSRGKLFISVAAGITVESLVTWLGQGSAIIRSMPNTPALVQQGMTGLHANENVSSEQRTVAEKILGSVGEYHWFEDEASLDVVTAISGSGPAYYFLIMESMQKAGVALGLPPEVSRKLVVQTTLGAAQMALESDLSTEQLRINVTSPGGTTQAALEKMLQAGLPSTISDAVNAAWDKSRELSQT